MGEKLGLDSDLWTRAPFIAGVVPDLPVISSWKQLGAKLVGRRVSGGVYPIVAYIIQAITYSQLE